MSHEAERAGLERVVSGLVGERLVGVSYTDVGSEVPWLVEWDFGDWHHAVMGVELMLASGPVTITWTNTFYTYGVEAARVPLASYLRPDCDAETWDVGHHARWVGRVGTSISAASLCWMRVDVGPAHRAGDGERVGDGYSVDVPVGLRVEFAVADSSPVWFLAAMPNLSEPDKAFIGGDEIMVLFAADKLKRLGFPNDAFVSEATGS